MKSSRLELAAVLALAAALVAAGPLFGTTKKADDARASTFVDSRGGLHALFLVLEGAGAKPRRLLSAPSAADPKDRTLVLANPSEPVTKRETAGIVDWVKAGGRLVVIGGPPVLGAFSAYAKPVWDAFGLHEVRAGAGEPLLVQYPALGDGLGKLDWPASRAVLGGKDFTTLVTRGTSCLVGRTAWGSAGGEVVVVSDAALVENESLGKLDNAVLAVRVLLGRTADQGRIVFDEFHHGFRNDGGAGHVGAALVAMLVDTWPGRAVLVLLFAGALALAGASVRLGAPERERNPPRRALSEHAEALGRLFETARARAVALRFLAAGARRATGPRAGIPAALSAAEFVRRMRTSPAPGAAHLAGAIERAESARASKDMEMAAIAANLAAAKRRYLHGGQ